MKVESTPGRTAVAAPPERNKSNGRTAAIVAIVVVMAAVGWWLLLRGDGDQAAVEQVIRDAIAAENAGDGATFVSFFTDAGLASYDAGSREEILAGEVELGQDQVEIDSFPEITIDGDSARATVHAAIPPVLYQVAFELVRAEGSWLIEEFIFEGGAPAAAGATVVDVILDEFSFGFDAAAMSSGDFAIGYENVGEQEHELLLMRIDEQDLTLDEILERAQSTPEGGEPEGTTHVGFLGFAPPDESGSVTFSEPLAAGRYVFVCLVPDATDPEQTPHLFKGMIAEFTVE